MTVFEGNDPDREMPERTARRLILGAIIAVAAVVALGVVAGGPDHWHSATEEPLDPLGF